MLGDTSDQALIVEFEDHTEVYDCYSPANYALIPEPADIPPYGVWIYPKVSSRELHVTIPEEKDGHIITAVTILARPYRLTPAYQYKEWIIKYLRIPSSVNYIGIAPKMLNAINTAKGCRVEISPENPHFFVYKSGIYSKDMTELYHIFPPHGDSDGCFEIPAGVERISACAGSYVKGLRRLIVPENVNEIGAKAFEYCSDLEYADIRAHKISSGAFKSCNKLKEVRLSEPLEKIEDHAFAYTDITKLTLPPSVRDIGHYILENADPTELTLEIRANNSAPIKMRGSPVEVGTLIVVLSPETNEKLLEFVILGKFKKVFTEHGIDLTGYDDLFKSDPKSQRFGVKVGLRAAQVRLSQLNEKDEEKREIFKQYISKAVFHIAMDAIIKYPNKSFDHYITDENYLDLIFDEDFLPLIDQAAHKGDPEITARLMQYYHERKSRE